MFVKLVELVPVYSVFICVLQSRYMYRRCIFLEQLPNLKYNLGVEKISGDHCSTFVGLMLEEVAAFINPRTQGPWSKSIPLQVIFLPAVE